MSLEDKKFKTEKENKVSDIFEKISADYDAANDRISLGMQKSWKAALTDAVIKTSPSSVLDVCCGTGDISLTLAEAGIQLTGLDFSEAMLSEAKAKEEKLMGGSDNTCIEWICGNAMELPFEDNSFDVCTISFGLRNTPDYRQVLSEMKRVSRKGIFILDSFVPQNKFIYPFYRLYFKTITPIIGGGTKHREEYKWLFESTRQFLSPDELTALLSELGFMEIKNSKFNFGTCCLIEGKLC